MVLGAYIRLLPAMNYGIELDANDPWVEYWLTKYLVEHGLGSWYTLTADNPATKAFWWPWGRDFYNSEYPGVPWFAAATAALGRSLGFDVKEWTALQPVIFACVAILLVFLLVKRLAGTAAGLVAAYMFAAMPGTSERTIVGFVEKTGVAIPLVYAYFLLFGMACDGRLEGWARYVVSAAAGVMLGLIGFFWGGVHFMIAVTAAYFLIMPIFREPGEKEWLQYLLLRSEGR
ncbi:TPA: peptide permease, partial [Candidatus Micrarchaeota archaeon]|nr:peptide permease [Candidatus Micrarchaeota archaeon]